MPARSRCCGGPSVPPAGGRPPERPFVRCCAPRRGSGGGARGLRRGSGAAAGGCRGGAGQAGSLRGSRPSLAVALPRPGRPPVPRRPWPRRARAASPPPVPPSAGAVPRTFPPTRTAPGAAGFGGLVVAVRVRVQCRRVPSVRPVRGGSPSRGWRSSAPTPRPPRPASAAPPPSLRSPSAAPAPRRRCRGAERDSGRKAARGGALQAGGRTAPHNSETGPAPREVMLKYVNYLRNIYKMYNFAARYLTWAHRHI